VTHQLLNKVLIVDDDPAIVRILTAYLKKGGYEVFAASNGQEALVLLAQHHPSFLITDWNMPIMDGLELCQRAREMDLPGYLFIVFLTGRSGTEDLVTALNSGADDFLRKPLEWHELMARLRAGARILRLEARLSQLAAHDALSGLLLRRAFSRFAEKEWHRASRYHLPLSIVMLDIDYFKQVNDTYGHPAGDEVIQGLTRLLEQNARQSDIVCRYGGEEFCVLLPETNEEMAVIWAERFRCQLAETTFHIGGTSLRITASLGVAEILAEMGDKDELLNLADQCLLAAKEQGRNRVVSFRSLSLSEQHLPDVNLAFDSDLDSITASDVMTPLVHCLHPDWSIGHAASYFLRFRISSAPVVDDDGQLLGIVSERDVLGVLHTTQGMERPVEEVMRLNVISYEGDVPLSRILKFLVRASMQSIMITAEGKPLGVVSRSAILRWFVENQWKIASMENALCDLEGAESLAPLVQCLVDEALELQENLQNEAYQEDVAPIVGGTIRIQQLLYDLQAGSAFMSPVGGGLPF
jgi:diguanylate cyclase (GGDEF)-like protein